MGYNEEYRRRGKEKRDTMRNIEGGGRRSGRSRKWVIGKRTEGGREKD